MCHIFLKYLFMTVVWSMLIFWVCFGVKLYREEKQLLKDFPDINSGWEY